MSLPIPDVTASGQAVLAVLVAVVGAARLTRIVTHDSWPPAAAVRAWWTRLFTREDGALSDWHLLAVCHWCFGPWAFAFALATAWATSLHPVWWVFWGWLAGSYLVSMIVERDEKD